MSVYTVKKTGMTCAGPQKCANVNIVLESSHTFLLVYSEMALWLLLLTLQQVSCQPFFGSLPPLPTTGQFAMF